MTENTLVEPAVASRDYDEFIELYELAMLEQPGDLQLEVDGNLAMTKDNDLRIGDQTYNGLFRLADHWRHTETHITCLFSLMELMERRAEEAAERLEQASRLEAKTRDYHRAVANSPEFLKAVHSNYNEEGAAGYGEITYSGCLVMLASNALLRFKDDIDCPKRIWTNCGTMYGGRSVGEIIIASANGFRHGDEWAKTRPLTSMQKRSNDVLQDALATFDPRRRDYPQPGRCYEVLHLLSRCRGSVGFGKTVLRFANAIATDVRPESAQAS